MASCEGVGVSARRQRRKPQGPWLLIYLVSATFVVVGAAAITPYQSTNPSRKVPPTGQVVNHFGRCEAGGAL